MSEAKPKEGIYDKLQIRTMLMDDTFLTKMTVTERTAFLGFKKVVEIFLGHHKSEDYIQLIREMVNSYTKLGRLMNLKFHFFHSHLDRFPENNEDYSEELRERFHEDLKVIERCYQERRDRNMIADYCLSIKK